jgi:hypothetical protein
MGTYFSKEKSPEELKEIRQIRIEYQDYLNNIRSKVTADTNSKVLTPESGILVLNQVQKGFDWLKTNPNASFNEVLANYDAVQNECKRIISTDKPKREFSNFIKIIPVASEKFYTDKKIDKVASNRLKEVASEAQTWYNKNSVTANEIQFSEQRLQINNSLTEILPETVIRDEFKQILESGLNYAPDDLQNTIAATEKAIQKKKDIIKDSSDSVTLVMGVALKTFLIGLLISFFILGGSLAANLAIGRDPIYRILYFIYGAVFFPVPIVTAIYKRFADGYFKIYSTLPVTQSVSDSWSPFIWIADNASDVAKKSFEDSLSAAIKST